MRISRLQIRNFRNLRDVDVPLPPGAVIVGGNRAGKSNLIYAVRLVLDPSLSYRDRVLDRDDFSDSLREGRADFDPLKEELAIEVSVELTDFENQPALLAALADALVEGDPMRARLAYRFAPAEADQGGPAPAYEWTISGGIEDTAVGWDVRRFLGHVHLPALRDAPGEVGSWQGSPLRPLLETAADEVDSEDLAALSDAILAANQEVAKLEPVKLLAERIGERTSALVGSPNALQTSLDMAPVEATRLLRRLQLLVDGDAQRQLSSASLGALNVLYLALLELGLDARLAADELAHVVLTIEEPEAHLHPHTQRALFASLLRPGEEVERTVLVTTHSPHIVSVADPSALVVLREEPQGSVAFSAGEADLGSEEWRDLQRYLDATRSEMVFASRVVLVEGFAELVLLPRFAAALQKDLDQLGITVCAIHGTHFATYVRFLSALGTPWVAITDGDPERRSTGAQRATALVEKLGLDQAEGFAANGIFVGHITLERDVYDVSAENRRACLAALQDEQIPASDIAAIGEQLKLDAPIMTSEAFLDIVNKAGKGSFAQRLAATAETLTPPAHVRDALDAITP